MTNARRFLVMGPLLLAVALCAAPRGHSSEAAKTPLSEHALERSRWTTLSGSVQERLRAGPYAYLRVRSEGRDAWVVSLAATTPASARVRVTVIGRAESFFSKRLQRRFDTLLFGIVRSADGAQPRSAERS